MRLGSRAFHDHFEVEKLDTLKRRGRGALNDERASPVPSAL